MNVSEVGRAVRKQRRAQALRQSELAAIAGVGVRFISDLENGKQSLELGRVITVLETLGLDINIQQRSATWPENQNAK